MTKTILQKLAYLIVEAERRGLDDIAYQTNLSSREIRASDQRQKHAGKGDQIEIESWPDFLNWWNTNRGQNLSYIFIDTYGSNSEQAKMVKKLISSSDKHERELHSFYMKLRDMSTNQPNSEDSPIAADDKSPLPIPEPEPVVEDESSDEEDALDEIALGLED